MMINPSSPSLSPICVAMKDIFRQDIDITIVPKNSTVSVTYTPMSTPVRFSFTMLNAPNKPPKTPATDRKRSAFSANGSVRRCCRCLREVHMMVVAMYWNAKHARLSKTAKQSVRYIYDNQYSDQMNFNERTQCGVADCTSLATGMNLYPASANAANEQKCTVLHARSHTESEVNRASKHTTWNQDVQRTMKNAM